MSVHSIQQLLSLEHPPVAVAFRDCAPAGVPRVDASAPAGCAYWKRASEGEIFYTEASDHYGCPIGAHTHGVDLPAEVAGELQGLIEAMVALEYIRMEEVPSIPRRAGAFRVAVYAPLDRAPVEPDVVLIRGTAAHVMLLAEAAGAAGAAPEAAPMGRPTCAVIPAAMASGKCAASMGCIGNRIYTGLGEGELYFAIPGRAVDAVAGRLSVIIGANRELERFHRARASD